MACINITIKKQLINIARRMNGNDPNREALWKTVNPLSLTKPKIIKM
jgi:hypothetical protein